MEENLVSKAPVNRKWPLLALVAFVIVAGAIYLRMVEKSEVVLGENIHLTVYTKGGKTSGGMVTLPIVKSSDKQYYASVGMDVSRNDKFSEEEWVVKNIPIILEENWDTNLPFKTSQAIDGSLKVRVVLTRARVGDNEFREFVEGEASVVKDVDISVVSLDHIFGTQAPSNPEESMKLGIAHARSEAMPYQSNDNAVPDFSQRPAECAPTVAANGLYILAMKNGARAKLPQDPQEMIAGLKGDMLWTPQDGVIPDNFVKGKNAWAVTHGLPIKTEKIGDKDGRGTLDEIKTALAGGSAVEMRIRFADANLKVIGGHIVSVVAVREADGKTFIDVNDPASPTGTETYPVSANEILNYPYHDGDTVVGWGFKQTWEGAPMGGQLDVMTDEEKQAIREFAGELKTIKAIRYNNKIIPLTEVHIGKGDHCDSKTESYPHYHSNNNSFALATDGSKVFDNTGCGYGKVKDTPVIDFQIP